MTIEDMPLMFLPDITRLGYTTGGTMRIANNTYAAANIIQAPKAGDITDVRFGLSAVNTGCDLDIRIEGVDASGNPDGSLISAGANVVETIADTDDSIWKEVTLGTPPTVTRGQVIAITYRVDSGTPINLDLQVGLGLCETMSTKFPYSRLYTGASWSGNNAHQPLIMLKYDGDTLWTVPMGCQPHRSQSSSSFSTGSNSTPDERGLKFTAPKDLRVAGCWVRTTNTGSDFDIVLYDSADSVLATASYDGEYSTGSGNAILLFDATVNLTEGATYRVVMKPTETSNTGFMSFDLFYTDCDLMYGGSFTGTSRTNAGAWTDDDSLMMCIGIVADGVDIPAGGGGSAYAFAG